ncbi:FG-GAP-like repeat-containing protein [Pseudoalteromonas sp. G4]|uniref:FG-GAP-like repeat-containing protein n=1 Tax=Pseudoalteromonas sp. G4 TaxID=2992761 RepID=UPI00237DA4B2|nr:FG-GAP-like repeat-containing protein [Pseudoalteromonas sp. G4]MDE3272075.1 FG-GAP-like repeat-containing protein [Pseudoalteromonas sp. G4]
MNKKLCAILLSLPVSAIANQITLEVVGNGNVKYGNETCSDSCTISTENNSVMLSPNVNAGGRFMHWSGQQCDFGQGVQTSTDRTTIGSASGGAKTLATLDLDNDGDKDLLGISLFRGQIIKYQNQGNGTFTSSNFISSLNYPSAMATHDVNADGFSDLLVAEYGARQVRVYNNDGAGQLAESEIIQIPGTVPYAITVEDPDQDGSAELIISSFTADTSGDLFQLVDSIKNQEIAIYSKLPDGYTKTKVISNTAAVTLDSYLDDEHGLTIVSAEIDTGNISLYRASDDFTGNVVDQSNAPYGVGFADVDDDGDKDIVTAHYGPYSLRIIYNNAGSYTAAVEIGSGNEGLTAVQVADYNLDGYQDIATGEFNTQRFYYHAANSYVECGVAQGSSIELTANFSATATPIPSEPEKDKTISSSGGTFSYLIMVLLALILVRRRII